MESGRRKLLCAKRQRYRHYHHHHHHHHDFRSLNVEKITVKMQHEHRSKPEYEKLYKRHNQNQETNKQCVIELQTASCTFGNNVKLHHFWYEFTSKH